MECNLMFLIFFLVTAYIYSYCSVQKVAIIITVVAAQKEVQLINFIMFDFLIHIQKLLPICLTKAAISQS